MQEKIRMQSNVVAVAVIPIEYTVVDPPPNTYMWAAIFTFCCCFWPLGLAAIVAAWKQSNVVAVAVIPIEYTVVDPPPNTYMWAAIFTFCCCFWPLGLAAIVAAWKKDLDMLAAMWNTHTLSSRSSILHEGNRPLMLYTLPELYGYENQLCTVNAHEVLLCEEETTPRPEHPCDETVKELCYDIMNETSNIMPEDAGSAKDLYLSLRTAILSQL